MPSRPRGGAERENDLCVCGAFSVTKCCIIRGPTTKQVSFLCLMDALRPDEADYVVKTPHFRSPLHPVWVSIVISEICGDNGFIL